MNDYLEVIALWNEERGPGLDGVAVPQSLAEFWVKEYGIGIIRSSLRYIIEHWYMKCLKTHAQPDYDLQYLRNYIQAGLRNEKNMGLVREDRHE